MLEEEEKVELTQNKRLLDGLQQSLEKRSWRNVYF